MLRVSQMHNEPLCDEDATKGWSVSAADSKWKEFFELEKVMQIESKEYNGVSKDSRPLGIP
jgi:hypothetical protein